MRAGHGLRIEPSGGRIYEYSGLGWLQAGFSSLAYRLAHLSVPRLTVVSAIALLFFLA